MAVSFRARSPIQNVLEVFFYKVPDDLKGIFTRWLAGYAKALPLKTMANLSL